MSQYCTARGCQTVLAYDVAHLTCAAHGDTTALDSRTDAERAAACVPARADELIIDHVRFIVSNPPIGEFPQNGGTETGTERAEKGTERAEMRTERAEMRTERAPARREK